MLVLSGKPGDRFYIGDNVVIEIVEFRGRDKIRLGFDAPKEVVIDRECVRMRKIEKAKAERMEGQR